jgi:hypothetical protein
MKAVKILLLVTAMLLVVDFAFAQTWTPTTAPNKNWSRIASSADGSKLIAVGLGCCYNSTNFGAAWTSNSEPQSVNPAVGTWYYIASSADGTKLLATTVSSVISVSTNSGMTWLSNNVPSVMSWGPVAMSADGGTLVAAAGGSSHPPGFIYISTNWGVTWTPTSAPTNVWTGLASSADGTKMFAVSQTTDFYEGYIYASTNSGQTWVLTGAPTNHPWNSVASSADGSRVVASSERGLASANSQGGVYTSIDYGMTWTSNSVPPGLWTGVASSADGTKLVAVTQTTPIGWVYTSTNSGANWISNSAPNYMWSSVASSADGNSLVAGAIGDQSINPVTIYNFQTTPSPQLNLSTSSSNLAISWLIPSTNFVLQQSADLISWATVTNTPVLNLTNLQNQITLPPSNSSGFYRLKTP